MAHGAQGIISGEPREPRSRGAHGAQEDHDGEPGEPNEPEDLIGYIDLELDALMACVQLISYRYILL